MLYVKSIKVPGLLLNKMLKGFMWNLEHGGGILV